MRRFPILYRVIAPYAALAVLGTSALFFYFSLIITRNLIAGSRQTLETITLFTNEAIMAENERLLTAADILLSLPQSREVFLKEDIPSLKKILIPFMARQHLELAMAFGSENRLLTVLSSREPPPDLLLNPLVKQGLLGMSRTGLIPGSERLLLAAVAPNETWDQGIKGGVLVAVDFKTRIEKVLAGLPAGLSLHDPEGRLLISTFPTGEFKDFRVPEETLRQVQKGERVFARFLDQDNQPHLALFSPLIIHGSHEAVLTTFLSLEEVFALRNQYVFGISFLSLIGLVLISGAGWLVTLSIHRPLKQLLAAVRKVEDGDLTTHTPVKGKDELSVLTGSFNAMVQKLKEDMFLLQKSLEEAKEASLTRSRFVAMVSHELKTPLSVILGYLELIHEGNLGEPTPEMMDTIKIIKRRTKELSGLIDNLLLVTRIEQGKKVSHRCMIINPEIVVQEAAADFSHPLRQKKITLSIENKTKEFFKTDPEFLKAIITNLIGNAVKFTPEKGKVTVALSQEGGPPDDSLILEVTDTGIGIPSQEKEKIFEPFYQVDSSLERSYGGAGLGLYIVKKMVALLDGEINLASDPSGGSRFTVIIPRCPTSAEKSTDISE